MKDINKTPQTKGVDAPAENPLRSRLTSMVSRVVGSVRSVVHSLMAREKPIMRPSVIVPIVPTKRKIPSKVIEYKDTVLDGAQPVLEYVWIFVNEHGWKEEMIPVVEQCMAKIISDTEAVIADFEAVIALYFQRYGYTGTNSFHGINMYSKSSALPKEAAHIISESLLRISNTRKSLLKKQKIQIPTLMRELRSYILQGPPYANNQRMSDRIRNTAIPIASDLDNIEKDYKAFRDYTGIMKSVHDIGNDFMI